MRSQRDREEGQESVIKSKPRGECVSRGRLSAVVEVMNKSSRIYLPGLPDRRQAQFQRPGV